MRINGIGLAPDDPCYDPQHPWLLPNMFHTAYECNCMVGEGRDPEQLCVSAAPGGTPATYTRPSNVPSYTDIVLQTPGTAVATIANVAGAAAANAGKGFWDAANLPGLMMLAGAGYLAFTYFTKRY